MKEKKKDMKVKIFLVLSVFLVIGVINTEIAAADMTPIPVTFNVVANFETVGENRRIELVFPNGQTKIWNWGATRPANEAFSLTITHLLNESLYCTRSTTGIKQYENITSAMTKMLDICGDVMSTQQNFSQVHADKLEFESLYLLEASQRRTLQNETETLRSERDQYRTQYNSCQSELSGIDRDVQASASLRQELDNCESGKNTNLLLGAVLGIAGGYMLWGRKKSSGPSEQAESGYSADYVDYGEE